MPTEDALETTRQEMCEISMEDRAELEAAAEDRFRLEWQTVEAAVALGTQAPPPAGHGSRLTLHEALAQILRENDNAWMTAQELTGLVNARRLYRKRDGSAIEVNHVHARTNTYRTIFEKDGAEIRLREE
jgi:hypothetical protein